jgi:hypothetical protein
MNQAASSSMFLQTDFKPGRTAAALARVAGNSCKEVVMGGAVASGAVAAKAEVPYGLWSRVDWLSKKVREKMPANSAVARAFAAFEAEAEALGDDDEPSLETLNAAMKALADLPPEHQRCVMNGWPYVAKYPSLAKIRGMEPSAAIPFRYAMILAGRGFPGVYCFSAFDSEEPYPTSVKVIITEGSSQAEAIAYLQEAMKAVRDRWDDLVSAGDFGFVMEERSDQADTLKTLFVGTGKSQEEPLPAA